MVAFNKVESTIYRCAVSTSFSCLSLPSPLCVSPAFLRVIGPRCYTHCLDFGHCLAATGDCTVCDCTGWHASLLEGFDCCTFRVRRSLDKKSTTTKTTWTHCRLWSLQKLDCSYHCDRCAGWTPSCFIFIFFELFVVLFVRATCKTCVQICSYQDWIKCSHLQCYPFSRVGFFAPTHPEPRSLLPLSCWFHIVRRELKRSENQNWQWDRSYQWPLWQAPASSNKTPFWHCATLCVVTSTKGDQCAFKPLTSEDDLKQTKRPKRRFCTAVFSVWFFFLVWMVFGLGFGVLYVYIYTYLDWCIQNCVLDNTASSVACCCKKRRTHPRDRAELTIIYFANVYIYRVWFWDTQLCNNKHDSQQFHFLCVCWERWSCNSKRASH